MIRCIKPIWREVPLQSGRKNIFRLIGCSDLLGPVGIKVCIKPGNSSIGDDDNEVQTALHNFQVKTPPKIPSPRYSLTAYIFRKDFDLRGKHDFSYIHTWKHDYRTQAFLVNYWKNNFFTACHMEWHTIRYYCAAPRGVCAPWSVPYGMLWYFRVVLTNIILKRGRRPRQQKNTKIQAHWKNFRIPPFRFLRRRFSVSINKGCGNVVGTEGRNHAIRLRDHGSGGAYVTLCVKRWALFVLSLEGFKCETLRRRGLANRGRCRCKMLHDIEPLAGET